MDYKKIILPAIFFLALLFTFAYFHGQMEEKKRMDEEQNLVLQTHDKQIPYIVKYVKLVKELERASKGKLTAFEVVEISRVIITYCQIYQDIGLTADKILALIERESAFNPAAISKARAYGLTQCIETVFDLHLPELGYGRFNKDLALNPIVNIEVGIKHLVYLRKYWLEQGG